MQKLYQVRQYIYIQTRSYAQCNHVIVATIVLVAVVVVVLVTSQSLQAFDHKGRKGAVLLQYKSNMYVL